MSSEHWFGVATPEYSYMENVYMGRGPIRTIRDYVEVRAEDAEEAKVEAVRKMREEGMQWVQDRATDDKTPYAGLEVTDLGPDCACGHAKGQHEPKDWETAEEWPIDGYGACIPIDCPCDSYRPTEVEG